MSRLLYRLPLLSTSFLFNRHIPLAGDSSTCTLPPAPHPPSPPLHRRCRPRCPLSPPARPTRSHSPVTGSSTHGGGGRSAALAPVARRTCTCPPSLLLLRGGSGPGSPPSPPARTTASRSTVRALCLYLVRLFYYCTPPRASKSETRHCCTAIWVGKILSEVPAAF